MLWQKYDVFPADVLNALLVWLSEPSNRDLKQRTQVAIESHDSTKSKKGLSIEKGPSDDQDNKVSSSGSEVVEKVTKLLSHIQKSLQSGSQRNASKDLESLQSLVKSHGNLLSGLDSSLLVQIQSVISSLMESCVNAEKQLAERSNKRSFIDYDYGEDSDGKGNESDGMDISDDDLSSRNTIQMVARYYVYDPDYLLILNFFLCLGQNYYCKLKKSTKHYNKQAVLSF